MYSEWVSLSTQITASSCGAQSNSVLNKFPASSGREVTVSVVKQLASNLGITQNAEPSHLVKDEEVNWCMDVICFGLSLPLQEHETIKDCVNVYCEWISALHPQPRISVPKPICEEANMYCRKIINHFHNIFVPRHGETADAINRQVVLCHRVLRTLQEAAQFSQTMERDTWEILLLFLIAINEILLAPPTVKDDVGDQLCERVLSVLFEVWLLACVRCYPSPSLWKTLQESCAMWRHRMALIDQWNRINMALMGRLLQFTYGQDFTDIQIVDEAVHFIPPGMTNDCVAQTWYRFLRIIGNPTALCSPHTISKSSHFVQWALTHDEGAETFQHPCLLLLPQIFLKAMKGISNQVDVLLGLSKGNLIALTTSHICAVQGTIPINSGPPSSVSITSLFAPLEQHVLLATNRSKCNSILHLFGEWLFEAAHIGGDAWLINKRKQATEASKRPSSMIMENRKGSISLSKPSPLNDSCNIPSTLTIDKYKSGRAEAIGTLCKIFCAKKTGEEILPVYSARFYMALQQCLKITENKDCDETLVCILINSADLFRIDLDGVNILLPSFIAALEIVLPEDELKTKIHEMNFNKTELRRASIQILLSILALPLHFQTLTLRNCSKSTESSATFMELRPRLTNILINALQVETDAQNTHMLLGGLLLTVQDAVCFEEIDMSLTEQLNARSTLSVECNVFNPGCSERSISLASGGDASCGSHNTAKSLAGDSLKTGIGADISGRSGHEGSGHDYPSMKSEEFPMDLLHEFENSTFCDNAHALFVRATYVVCHRLISSWKTDLNISLAALELLTGLARMNIRDSDALECKRAVKWICDYICYQCSRPPPAHSKDVHSTIVAAFQCTSAWLQQHPYLLQDKECLQTVLEVVELGISGCKSFNKMGKLPKFKEEKELKPASLRVRDAAEILLTHILEQVGYFPGKCGPDSVSSLLDEFSLIKHCGPAPNRMKIGNDTAAVMKDEINVEQAVAKFRYFVTEKSTVLALLEEPLGNDQDAQPTVTLLLRGPYGRHAWTMQFRHLPRSKSGTKYHTVNPGRPIPMNDALQQMELDQRCYPGGVDKVTACVVDCSIPTMENIREQVPLDTICQLEHLVENQTIYEELAWAATDNNVDSLSHTQESVQPSVCHEFQAARLFLSHFGLIKFEEVQETDASEILGSTAQYRPLILLDTKQDHFADDLSLLDQISPRTHDTVHIFYVRAGQVLASDIVSNMNDREHHNLDSNFSNMLLNLGWPVDVENHSGWTGFDDNSWRLKNIDVDKSLNIPEMLVKNLKFNGENHIIYWADFSSEIAFVVPTFWNKVRLGESAPDGNLPSEFSSRAKINTSVLVGDNIWKYSTKEAEAMNTQKFRNTSLDLDAVNHKDIFPPSRRKTNATKSALLPQVPAKILLVWLECFEDCNTLPIDDLLPYTETGEKPAYINRAADIHVIFLQPLRSGLVRVKLQNPQSRMSVATPLVDGMVLNLRVVGDLVRQTAHNMARRKRLDNDNYQPPHVRRRLKVQDILQKYRMELNEPELLSYLYKGGSV